MRTKFKNKRLLCACGCENFVGQSKLNPYQWNKFICGHNNNRKGTKLSKEHKLKISKFHKGKKHSLETKLKMSKAHTGKKLSIEHIEKMRQANIGKKMSTESIEKIRLANLGEKSPRWKGGISCEPYCDVWLDKEYKQSIRDRDNNKCQNPDCWKTNFHLTIHHINYIKKDCVPRNLITLCCSCNSRANKNRKEWTVFYQEIIKQKYKLRKVA